MVASVADGPSPAAGASESRLPYRHVAAVALGNALEFYDFLTFSFFAVPIGHVFFPSTNATNSLLGSLVTFMVGFLTRPLGGIVIGMLGDRVGRRPAMLLSFGLMGVGIVGLALTPSYAAIGIAAPVMVVVFRMIQGFALGGEVGPSTAFLVEAAPPERRGFYVSLQYATQDAAILVAGLVGVVLSNLMDDAMLEAWGWRLAFLLGAAVVPFGLAMRRSLPETLHAPAATETPKSGGTSVRRIVLLGFFMLTATTISAYVIDYLTTYAIHTLAMPTNVAFGATVVAGLCGVIFEPLAGWLSDRVGRRRLMLPSIATVIVIVVPVFMALARWRSAEALYAGTAVLGICQSLGVTPALVSLTESLPRRIRSGALATIYALAIGVFGGSAQAVVTELIDLTGSPIAPAWYMMGALSLGIVAMAMMPETAPARIARLSTSRS